MFHKMDSTECLEIITNFQQNLLKCIDDEYDSNLEEKFKNHKEHK